MHLTVTIRDPLVSDGQAWRHGSIRKLLVTRFMTDASR
jgi:hypothetical protein